MKYEQENISSVLDVTITDFELGNIDSAHLDARLLLCAATGLSDLALITQPERKLSLSEAKHFYEMVLRRLANEPVSQILGYKEFWSLKFEVSSDVLTPRPDSETVIESILKHIPDKSKSFKILDLGSGSGCLGLSLINEYKNSKVTFLDISKNSLQVVKANAFKFNLYEKSKFVNLDWRNSDWEKKLLKLEKNIKFDLIVSNPPYIASNDIKNLQIEVKDYEPIIALDGGKDGLDAFRFIMPKINNLLKENGKIFIEIGKGQQNQVEKIASDYGLFAIDFVKDFSGIIRVLIFIIK